MSRGMYTTFKLFKFLTLIFTKLLISTHKNVKKFTKSKCLFILKIIAAKLQEQIIKDKIFNTILF